MGVGGGSARGGRALEGDVEAAAGWGGRRAHDGEEGGSGGEQAASRAWDCADEQRRLTDGERKFVEERIKEEDDTWVPRVSDRTEEVC